MKIPTKVFPILYSVFVGSGFLICFILTVLFHWEKAIKNHCKVWEFFPSVSAVIGDYKAETITWSCAIALSSGPRIICSLISYSILIQELKAYERIIKWAFIFDFSRILCAGIWTYVSSSDHLLIHEVFYVFYVLLSFTFMTMHTWLYSKSASQAIQGDSKGANIQPSESNLSYQSYKWKYRFCFTQWLMFCFSLFFFYQHNVNCRPGAYSMYALVEWTLAICNVFYEATYIFDFHGYISISNSPAIRKSN